MDCKVVEGRLEISDRDGSVSSLAYVPDAARALLILGHGAGVGMRHGAMEALAEALAGQGVATFRYQFPYMERGRRFPDPLPVRLATIDVAVAHCAASFGAFPLFAGGRSMGGRMSSTWVAGNRGAGLAGLVFYGFPLHPAGKPGTSRGMHLKDVDLPMLFLQGTRDKLAELELLEPLVADLGKRARLHVVDGADHGFHVLKRSGRSADDVMRELAAETGRFIDQCLPAAPG